MSIITSMLKLTGLILSEWILAYFIIILNGLVLKYSKRITDEFYVIIIRMRSSKLNSISSFAKCIPCLILIQNGILLYCIQYSLFSVRLSSEFD